MNKRVSPPPQAFHMAAPSTYSMAERWRVLEFARQVQELREERLRLEALLRREDRIEWENKRQDRAAGRPR
jgi:hypothetical protein